MKHLNARQLYIQNRKLANQNRVLHAANKRQSNIDIQRHTAMEHARELIVAENNGNGTANGDDDAEEEILSVAKVLPKDDGRQQRRNGEVASKFEWSSSNRMLVVIDDCEKQQ